MVVRFASRLQFSPNSVESPEDAFIFHLGPIAANWSDWVGIMVTTQFSLLLGLFVAPRGPKRAHFGPKCPFLGVLKVLGGSKGTIFGPETPGLLHLGWIHGYNRLWPGIGPLPGGQGPRKGPFRL